MNIRNWRTIFTWFLCSCCLLGFSPIGHAENTLPPGMVIGDSEGVYATSEGEYYVDLINLLPGEVYEKEITIRSLDLEEPFSLGLLAEWKDSSGVIDWRDHIDLTLVLDDKELYQGPILGNGDFDWTKTPLELGVCKYGTDKVLKATFKIDSALTNKDYREDNVMTFYWTFVATKDQKPTKPTDSTEPSGTTEPSLSTDDPPPSSVSSDAGGKLPSTGNTDKASGSGKRLPQTGEQIMYMFLSGMLLVLIALFLWKKRREEEQG